MKRLPVVVAVLFATLITFGTPATLAETVKTKVITLVDRDVTCPDSPVTLYSGNPTFMVTGEIQSISLEVTKSCPCTVCVYFEAYPANNTVRIRSCSGGNQRSSMGAYNVKEYSIKTIEITAQKINGSNCTVSHITARIIVKYTGDWLEPPESGGQAPISPGSAILVALVVFVVGIVRRR